jgi:predicted TIM-barrel fold metal-dependent hydrolase
VIRLPTPGTPPAPAPLRKIAIEEHILDPVNTSTDFAALAASGGLEASFYEVVLRRLRDFTSVRLPEMDAAGIEVSVLSLTAPGIEGIRDLTMAVADAQRVNDFLADRIRDGGGRFEGFASVLLQDTDAAITETERAVRELGLRGVLVNGYVDIGADTTPHYLDEDRFDAFWQALADLGVPLYLHPRSSVEPVRRSLYGGHPELTGATWGFAPETATHALRLIYGGVFDRHPNASLILGHMGETLPFFAWRIQRAFEYNPFQARPDRRLQDYLSDNVYVTTSGNFSSQALITAILTMSADHILFATDYPYELPVDAARWIETAPISENDRRKIIRSNAVQLLGLADKPS